MEKYVNVEEAHPTRKNEVDAFGHPLTPPERKSPHLTSWNGISRPLVNYTLIKVEGEKAIQVLDENSGLARPMGYPRQPSPWYKASFCALHNMYSHST